MKCENCHQELLGEKNFCSNCGQKSIPALSLKFLVSEFLDNYFNFDSKLFQTLKFLAFKPGFLSQEFMRGKRIKFVPPVRLYIVISFIFFLLVALLKTPAPENEQTNLVGESSLTINGVGIEKTVPELQQMKFKGELDPYLDSLTSESSDFQRYFMKKLAYAKVNGDSFLDVLLKQVSLFLLLFIPLLALLYAMCFSKNEYGYIGHLVFNLYLNSFIIFLLCFDRIVRFFTSSSDFNLIWTIIIFIIIQVYLIVATKRFYERSSWVIFYKYILLIIGYAVLALLFLIMVFMASLVMS